MADNILLVFAHPGPGIDEPILGLTGLQRSVQALLRAGFPRVVVVSEDGLSADSARNCLPLAFRSTATVVPRDVGESETDLVRRIAGNAPGVAIVDSDVVIGPKDAPTVAKRVIAGQAVSVEGGLVLGLTAAAIASLPAGMDLAHGVAEMDQFGRLGHVTESMLVRRLDGTQASRLEVEERLLLGLRKPLDIDGVVGFYLQRPVTTRVSRLLAQTRITPNQLTLMAMAAGLFSGVLVAMGNPF